MVNRLEIAGKLRILLNDKKLYTRSDITLSSLAKQLKTNRTYLSEIIHSHFDSTFIGLINLLRVKEAQLKFQDTTNHPRRIEEIAHSVGFRSKSSFNTAFKRYTGLTPSQYREKQKETNTTKTAEIKLR